MPMFPTPRHEALPPPRAAGPPPTCASGGGCCRPLNCRRNRVRDLRTPVKLELTEEERDEMFGQAFKEVGYAGPAYVPEVSVRRRYIANVKPRTDAAPSSSNVGIFPCNGISAMSRSFFYPVGSCSTAEPYTGMNE